MLLQNSYDKFSITCSTGMCLHVNNKFACHPLNLIKRSQPHDGLLQKSENGGMSFIWLHFHYLMRFQREIYIHCETWKGHSHSILVRYTGRSFSIWVRQMHHKRDTKGQSITQWVKINFPRHSFAFAFLTQQQCNNWYVRPGRE